MKGHLVASIFVGVVETFSRILVPELIRFHIFGLMAVVLVFKPSGLLGKNVA
ncbi:hypothetical protein [Salipaludibacillus sp. CF4.18]|uniref:hypothetical protein n=1 Tax=Salipaludibacillus sp. CF4.18 TaxID=3373081 RepID=UPI003EE6E941